jgi:predicted nucleic acid-binding protein
VDAFDADVLIYAAATEHVLGRRVRGLFVDTDSTGSAGTGSVLLLPELLSKPLRDQMQEELTELGMLLGHLELRPVDLATAELSVVFGASYGLRAADAVHLATAVLAGADRFITNNKADFSKAIVEIEVTYPEELPELGERTFV